jgi:competence protein ComEC
VIGVLVTPLALLAVLLLWLWQPLADALFWLLDWILQILYAVLEYMATLPTANLNHPAPPLWALAFAVPGILLLLAPKGIPARWAGLAFLLPLVFVETEKPAPGDIKLTMLDVGQGLALVVQTANHWLVYDTGAKFSTGSDQGQHVLLPFLRSQGVSQLDQLIISHGDNDHIGGAASLLNEIPANKVLTSVPDALEPYAPEKCRAGQQWTWDAVRFTILSPGLNSPESDNDLSCVLKIDAAQISVLLTGDIEAGGEAWLLANQPEQLKADILVSPHHGSHSSSTAEFLAAVKPRTILISAGYRNSYGHPHPDIMARYRQSQANIYNTANNGAISISAKAIYNQRALEARYWHSKQPSGDNDGGIYSNR